MSLQDEHLKQALQSAPDRDLAPSDAVRQQVLDYAKNASAKQPGWLNRFKAWRISSWQLVGMSTLASVFLVTIMLRPQLSKEPVWNGSDMQDIAQAKKTKSETLTPEKLESAATNSVSQAEVMPPKGEEVVVTSDDDYTNLSKKSEVVKPQPKVIAKAKKENSEAKAQPADVLADHEEVLNAAPVPSQPVAIAEAETDVAEEAVVADKTVVGVASRMERRQAAAKPNVAVRKSELPSDETTRGGMLATKDIQAGNFRLLFVEGRWPEGKPLLDEETGFPVEAANNVAAEMTVVDVEAYNQIMRAWYNLNH